MRLPKFFAKVEAKPRSGTFAFPGMKSLSDSVGDLLASEYIDGIYRERPDLYLDLGTVLKDKMIQVAYQQPHGEWTGRFVPASDLRNVLSDVSQRKAAVLLPMENSATGFFRLSSEKTDIQSEVYEDIKVDPDSCTFSYEVVSEEPNYRDILYSSWRQNIMDEMGDILEPFMENGGSVIRVFNRAFPLTRYLIDRFPRPLRLRETALCISQQKGDMLFLWAVQMLKDGVVPINVSPISIPRSRVIQELSSQCLAMMHNLIRFVHLNPPVFGVLVRDGSEMLNGMLPPDELMEVLDGCLNGQSIVTSSPNSMRRELVSVESPNAGIEGAMILENDYMEALGG